MRVGSAVEVLVEEVAGGADSADIGREELLAVWERRGGAADVEEAVDVVGAERVERVALEGELVEIGEELF